MEEVWSWVKSSKDKEEWSGDRGKRLRRNSRRWNPKSPPGIVVEDEAMGCRKIMYTSRTVC